MKKVAIIGGGLAGLTTAFYLSQNKTLEVVVYESEKTLGGRVKTVDINGFKFDYGAFMIFPWYKSYIKLLEDLQYEHEEKPIILDKEFAWDENTHSFHEINKHWTFEGAALTTLIKSLRDFAAHKSELYNPDTRRFNGITLEQYIKSLDTNDSRSLDLINKLVVGYTYGEVSELPLSIYFGFAKEILLHNGFKNVHMLKGGASGVIEALRENLVTNGVKIKLNAKINVKNKKAYLGNSEISSDYTVFATGQNDILESFTVPIKKPVTYNNHFAALVRTDRKLQVNEKSDWNLLYTATINQHAPQLSCIANLNTSLHEAPKNTYITYLRIPKAINCNEIKAKNLIKTLFKKYFPANNDLRIDFIHHWENTMPIVSIESLNKIQSLQGKNSTYFAGDYLGAPSMEVAIRSGKEVAKLINIQLQ